MRRIVIYLNVVFRSPTPNTIPQKTAPSPSANVK